MAFQTINININRPAVDPNELAVNESVAFPGSEEEVGILMQGIKKLVRELIASRQTKEEPKEEEQA